MIVYLIFAMILMGMAYKSAGSTKEEEIQAKAVAADARYERTKEKNAQTRKDVAAVGKFATGLFSKKKKGFMSGFF